MITFQVMIRISSKLLYFKIFRLLENYLATSNRLLYSFIGEKWKLHRKLIQPYFHINILENFVPIFAETSRDLASKFENARDANVTTFINDWVLDTLHSK